MIWKSKGFTLTITGRAGLLYKDGDKIIKVDSEMLTGPEYDIAVYADSIRRWEPPFDQIPLSQEDRQQIVKNIKSSLEKDGYVVDLVGAFVAV